MSKSTILSKDDQPTADVAAAIAMALYDLNGEVHDVENAILTFNKSSKFYSPWSSKIHNMRRLPDVRR